MGGVGALFPPPNDGRCSTQVRHQDRTAGPNAPCPMTAGARLPGNPFGSRSWGKPPRPRCLTNALQDPMPHAQCPMPNAQYVDKSKTLGILK
jgi:hypothetical protein